MDAALPVALTQTLLHELAGGLARQLIGKIDTLGALEVGDVAATEVDQLLRELRARIGAPLWHDERFYLLSELRVGYPEYRDVVDLRMRVEKVLDFLGVDVDAAGDDDEVPAVREVEITVRIQMPDVAHGRPAARVVGACSLAR